MFNRFIKAWLPVAAMCLAIFLFSQDANSGRHSNQVLSWILSILGINTGHIHRLLDEPFRKLAHVVVYFLLGSLTYRGFALGRKVFNLPAAYRSLVFCAAYAITDEYHQSFVPGRGPSPRDVALDTAAALLALILIWAFFRPRRDRHLISPVAQAAK